MATDKFNEQEKKENRTYVRNFFSDELEKANAEWKRRFPKKDEGLIMRGWLDCNRATMEVLRHFGVID